MAQTLLTLYYGYHDIFSLVNRCKRLAQRVVICENKGDASEGAVPTVFSSEQVQQPSAVREFSVFGRSSVNVAMPCEMSTSRVLMAGFCSGANKDNDGES